jgi:hypothetical protein
MAPWLMGITKHGKSRYRVPHGTAVTTGEIHIRIATSFVISKELYQITIPLDQDVIHFFCSVKNLFKYNYIVPFRGMKVEHCF